MRSGNGGGRSFADSIVQPGGDYENAANSLAESFIAGRKTPQEIQGIAARTALAQQALTDAQFKQQQEVGKRNAILASQGIFDGTHPDLYTTDQGGVAPTIQSVLTSPAGAKALNDAASNYVAAGGDIGQFQGLSRYNASVDANNTDSGVNDESVQRLGGSQPLAIDQALSLPGQEAIKNRNVADQVFVTNATKNMKDVVQNKVITDKLNGVQSPQNVIDANYIGNPMTPENASAVQSANEGIDNLAAARKLLIDPITGKFNEKNIINAALDTPFTEGREMGNHFDIALAAQRHLETGARMSLPEVHSLRERFMPSPFDNAATKAQKYNNLQSFMAGTLHFVDPTNPYLMKDDKSNAIIDLGGGATKSTPQGTTTTNSTPAPVINPAALNAASQESFSKASTPLSGESPIIQQQVGLQNAAAPRPAPAMQKSINGQNFINHNGKWYQQ